MSRTQGFYADEQLFRLIVQATPAGLLLVDGEGYIVLVSQRALKLLDYREEELLGQPVEKLIPDAHQAAHVGHRVRYMSQPQTRPMAAGRDLYARRRDGSALAVDISLHPLETPGGTYVLANILDATDRRRAEREAERRQALERLALLGQLAGGVAHEIRTPLGVIRNDVYFLERMADRLGPEGIECIEEIKQAVGKANRIVSELLDFTHEPRGNPTAVSLEAVLNEALREIILPPTVALIRPPSDVLQGTLVNADHEQIARILTNLFRNAEQAMDGHGEISVALQTDAQRAMLTICDTGPGIKQEHRQSIFEPLFTTKPNGIGLGLAVSQRYAIRNQGQLELLTDHLEGACFRLTLPRALAEPQANTERPAMAD